MIHNLPDDIIYSIFKRLNISPISFLGFRDINHQFRRLIDSLEGIYEDNTYEKEINAICLTKVSLLKFQWLFKNKVNFSLESLKNLIIANRYDVIQEGLNHEKFSKIIFNRFYIHSSTASNDIFSITESLNPIIVAGRNNRLKIIELLLEYKVVNNPYVHSLIGLLDISIKYNYKGILSYLIINHYASIQEGIQNRLNKILHRIDNCEDIFFYLISSNRISITLDLFKGFILRKYNELFKYCYTKSQNTNLELIGQCIETNNEVILDYLLSGDRISLSSTKFTELFFRSKKGKTKELINLVIINHLGKVKKNTKLITLCIVSSIDDDKLIELIKKGYEYTTDDMQKVLLKKKILVLKYMCENMLE